MNIRQTENTSPRANRRMFVLRFFFALWILFCGISLQGCFIIRPLLGPKIDIAQLQKDREFTILHIREIGAQSHLQRLKNDDAFENADIRYYFSQAFINNVVAQLGNVSGFIDSLKSYSIKSINVELENGSAIATIVMTVHDHESGAQIELFVDCFFTIGTNGKFDTLSAYLIPIIVTPTAIDKKLTSDEESILEEFIFSVPPTFYPNFPVIQLPIDVRNQIPIQTNPVEVRNGMNVIITTPKQILKYELSVREIMFFKEKMFIAFRMVGVKVEK